MVIELTPEQSQAVAAGVEAVVLVDPRTNRIYRLIGDELFRKVQGLLYDDLAWTPEEAALLAGQAFAQLDDTDYSEYLRDAE